MCETWVFYTVTSKIPGQTRPALLIVLFIPLRKLPQSLPKRYYRLITKNPCKLQTHRYKLWGYLPAAWKRTPYEPRSRRPWEHADLNKSLIEDMDMYI